MYPSTAGGLLVLVRVVRAVGEDLEPPGLGDVVGVLREVQDQLLHVQRGGGVVQEAPVLDLQLLALARVHHGRDEA